MFIPTCIIYHYLVYTLPPHSNKPTHAHTLQSSAIVGSTLLATIEQLAFNVLAPNEDGFRTSNIGMGREVAIVLKVGGTGYHNSFLIKVISCCSST